MIQEVANGPSKDMARAEIFVEFHGSRSLVFCGNVRLGISFSSREVAHRLSKLRKSQSSEFCFFRNDV